MPVNFCPLARKAATGPDCDLSAKSMPHELRRHQFLRGSCSWVRQRVDGVEYLFAPGFRHYRSCYACRHVTQKGESSVFKRDVFQTEVRNGRTVILNIRVILLIGSHSPVVQPWFDGIYRFEKEIWHLAVCWLKFRSGSLLADWTDRDNASGQCIGDDIILARHVLYVRGELGDGCKVS